MKKVDLKDYEYLAFVGRQESQWLQTKDYWRDAVLDIIDGNVIALGDFLPWPKTHEFFRMRPREITIWAGVNGSGKSLCTGQVALSISQHTPVLIASLEMPPERTLVRMVRQAAACDNVSHSFAEKFLNHATDNMWIYDQTDAVEPERILGLIHYSANQLGVKHIFVDSLMKVVKGTQDWDAMKDFVDQLCWIAKTEAVHIHLVHHMRKGESEDKPGGKFDVRGASEIVDLCDNLMLVHRIKTKEEKIRKLKAVGEPVPQSLLDEPDAILNIAKQRHGEWEGKIRLWFHAKSLQYVQGSKARPQEYRIS